MQDVGEGGRCSRDGVRVSGGRVQVSLQHARQLVEIRAIGVEYRSSPPLSGAVRDGKKEFALRASVAGSGWDVRMSIVCV